MTFWQNVIATLIGTVAGFGFAILLIFLTEWIKDRRTAKRILEWLHREVEYNLELIDSWHTDIQKTITKITNGDHKAYYSIAYTHFSYATINRAFNEGILYKLLNNEELAKLDRIVRYFNQPHESLVNQMIVKWSSGSVNPGTKDAQEIVNLLEYERDTLEEDRKFLTGIAAKLKTKLPARRR